MHGLFGEIQISEEAHERRQNPVRFRYSMAVVTRGTQGDLGHLATAMVIVPRAMS